MGGGIGHLYRMLPICAEFLKQGCEVIWAIPELNHAQQFIQQPNSSFVQSPVWDLPPQSLSYSQNYGENLLKNGYLYANSLRKHINDWGSLMESHQPDLVVAEHAPTALIASRYKGIPHVAIGTGFTVPPMSNPMPGLQPWFKIPDQLLRQKEQKFLDAVNPVLENAGCTPLSSVSDIFQEAERFLCTYPEFDHYGTRENIPYHGPVVYSSPNTKPQWPSDGNDNVFLYLNPDNRFLLPVMEQLRIMDFPVLAYIPGLSDNERQSLMWKNLRITPDPVNLMDVGQRCRFAVSQAGHNTGTLMLLQGVPLLLCPRQLEQAIWAYRIAEQELGVMISYFDPEPDFQRKIETILSSDGIRNRVKVIANKYSNSDPHKRVESIAASCINHAKTG